MAFNVKYNEVQDLQCDYQEFENTLRDAEYALNDRIGELVNLDTFRGGGATSIKSYFSEVHQPLLQGLDTLAHQLATEFSDYYYTRFGESPISENDVNAQWPSSAMNDARKALENLRDGDLASAESALQRAVAAMPSGVAFHIPNVVDAKDSLEDEISYQKKVRDAIKNTEEEAASVFESASGDFSAMQTSLASLIAACGKGNYTVANYVPGSFISLMEETGFIDAYNACAQYQDENAEMLVAAREDSIAKKQTRIEIEAQKAAEEKKTWAIIGTIASVAVMVGAACAVVASAGAATPLLVAAKAGIASIGLATATWDTAKRVDQLNQILDGDPYAQRFDDNEMLGEGIDATKTYGKYKVKQYEAEYWDANDYHYRSAAVNEQAKGVRDGYFTDQVVDFAIDQIPDEGAKTAVKITKEIYDEVSSQYDSWRYSPTLKDFKVDAGGVIGTVGKCGTIFADYNLDQADARLNDLREESNNLDALQQKSAAQQSYDWGTTW